ncbi:MAG: phosphoribosylamine--glycine ligase [Phycisphaerae bacterium]|nr:phosphoribosylamine--glycine ligase [Phycisphaerae bacterium]
MNVLVIGSGGREHALCYCLARSAKLDKLFILPGNAGTAGIGTNIPGDADDIDLALSVARQESIDLTIIGPEDPLAAGMADAFEAAGLRVFGPRAEAARLEADKAFAKQLMRQYVIPTAEARTFTDYPAAREYIATRDEPVVVKASGLAKGKGVIVCNDPSDAILAAEDMLVKRTFGEAGARIVVEEKLLGQEASLLAIVDGHTTYLLEPAQDHKRLSDNDQGPNTGGMGSFSPSPLVEADALQKIQAQILVPTLDALVHEGIHYRGILYLGLMFTTAGPKVLEFNCRFGDPETQAILPRLRSDLLELLDATVDGRLEEACNVAAGPRTGRVEWDPRHALCVVMASGGYPGKYPTGLPITGLPENTDDLIVFHAGTKRAGDQIVTSGGRVLGVTALGETLADARRRVYDVVEQIHFEGAHYRTDLGS